MKSCSHKPQNSGMVGRPHRVFANQSTTTKGGTLNDEL